MWHTRASLTSSCLPWMTRSTLSATRENEWAKRSQSLAVLRASTHPPALSTAPILPFTYVHQTGRGFRRCRTGRAFHAPCGRAARTREPRTRPLYFRQVGPVERALVLNATHEPLAVVPARRAVVPVLREKAVA